MMLIEAVVCSQSVLRQCARVFVVRELRRYERL